MISRGWFRVIVCVKVGGIGFVCVCMWGMYAYVYMCVRVWVGMSTCIGRCVSTRYIVPTNIHPYLYNVRVGVYVCV